MSMHIGNATVAVIQSSRSGMNCEAFPNKLAAVLRMIDFGDLGPGGNGYGCDEHKAALLEVEKQIAETRKTIAEMEARDAAGVTDGDGDE